jgi:hypothetical protein
VVQQEALHQLPLPSNLCTSFYAGDELIRNKMLYNSPTGPYPSLGIRDMRQFWFSRIYPRSFGLREPYSAKGLNKRALHVRSIVFIDFRLLKYWLVCSLLKASFFFFASPFLFDSSMED